MEANSPRLYWLSTHVSTAGSRLLLSRTDNFRSPLRLCHIDPFEESGALYVILHEHDVSVWRIATKIYGEVSRGFVQPKKRKTAERIAIVTYGPYHTGHLLISGGRIKLSDQARNTGVVLS